MGRLFKLFQYLLIASAGLNLSANDNLFVNPGFENATLDPYIGPMNVQIVTRGSLDLVSQPENVFNGSHAMRHTASGADSFVGETYGSNVVATGSQDVTMQLNVWAKADNPGTPVQLRIFSLDQNQQFDGSSVGIATYWIGTDWTQLTVRLNCPANRPYASIRLDNDGGAGAEVWWDNISFFKATTWPSPPEPFNYVAENNGCLA